MPVTMEDKLPEKSFRKLKEIESVLDGARRLLIVTHDHPDPDALAAALTLRLLVKEKFGIRATIAAGGFIGRAENREMVRLLKIPLKPLEKIDPGKYDRIALLDTQPAAGNHSLPPQHLPDLVFDHHPRKRKQPAAFTYLDQEVGSTTTMLAELLLAAGLDADTQVATAISYAIRSETQDLGRETFHRDLHVYYYALPKSSVRKLAKIIHPALPTSYFASLYRALGNAWSYRHLICTSLGEVEFPEMVAEVADLFLRHRRTSYALAMGRFNGYLVLSLRCSNANARAYRIIRDVLRDSRNAGGHGSFAGGRVSLSDKSPEEVNHLEEEIRRRFAARVGHPEAIWKPMLPDEIKP